MDEDYGYVNDWAKQPALTRVSRQVRAETLPMYYGSNAFVVYADFQTAGPTFKGAQHWLQHIGKSNGALINRSRFVSHYSSEKSAGLS